MKQPDPVTAKPMASRIPMFLGICLALLIGACSSGPEGEASDVAAPDSTRSDPNVIVHLFEWRWDDIAEECEQFVGPAGYGAVQVSPVVENSIVKGRPWYEKYQPVSYTLDNRSGDRVAFAEMVDRCSRAGVDIVVDVILNHMTGVYAGTGTAGSQFAEYDYPGLYAYDDFHHCPTEGSEISNWDDPIELRECELLNLADLKTESPSVRSRLAAFLADLASLGVKGIRIDAAKHMQPADVKAILEEAGWTGYVVQEVTDGGARARFMPEYYPMGSVTEFRYGRALAGEFRAGTLARLHGPGSIREEVVWAPSNRSLVFVDNHDTQRGADVLTHKDGRQYTLAQVFTLAYPYGRVRVMSSYEFDEKEQGPPALASGEVDRVYQGNKVNCNLGEWLCEHRRPEIAGAVRYRTATSAADSVTHWWTNGSNQIAFGRGPLGFVVINASKDSLTADLPSGLPDGSYCDRLSSADCQEVMVSEGGLVRVVLPAETALAIDVSHTR